MPRLALVQDQLVMVSSGGLPLVQNQRVSRAAPTTALMLVQNQAVMRSTETVVIFLTTGGQYFLNTTGGPTATMPSAQSTIVYVIGTAVSDRTILFNPVYLGSNAT